MTRNEFIQLFCIKHIADYDYYENRVIAAACGLADAVSEVAEFEKTDRERRLESIMEDPTLNYL